MQEDLCLYSANLNLSSILIFQALYLTHGVTFHQGIPPTTKAPNEKSVLHLSRGVINKALRMLPCRR